MLATTAGMLRRLGYNVQAVSGGEVAVKLFCTHPAGFDLVLTDMAMKGGTGLELAQRLLRVHSHTPIALMTGFAGHLTEESLRSVGISGLIMKPFTLSELGAAIRRIIDEPASIAQHRSSHRPPDSWVESG
jgi:CheY-like chemotaxis protein